MKDNEKNLSAEESVGGDRTVPDKQVHRWKDDGGALEPEPDSETAPHED
jgi:hypothetical protein